MLYEPMGGGCAGAHGSADEDTGAPADQSANEHARTRAAGYFDLIAPVMPAALEETFFVHVGSRDVGVDQNCVQHEALSIGENNMLRKNPDAWLALDPARFTQLGHAALDGRACRNDRLAVDHDGIDGLALEWISDLAAESGDGGLQFDLERRSFGHGWSCLRPHGYRQEQYTHASPKLPHDSSCDFFKIPCWFSTEPAIFFPSARTSVSGA